MEIAYKQAECRDTETNTLYPLADCGDLNDLTVFSHEMFKDSQNGITTNTDGTVDPTTVRRRLFLGFLKKAAKYLNKNVFKPIGNALNKYIVEPWKSMLTGNYDFKRSVSV